MILIQMRGLGLSIQRRLSACWQSQFSRVPQMAVANYGEIDGRITIWYHRMANLMVYLLKVSNSRRVDRHLRYPGNPVVHPLPGKAAASRQPPQSRPEAANTSCAAV